MKLFIRSKLVLCIVAIFLSQNLFSQQSSREIIAQLDKPAAHRQLSYSPEEGSTVVLNPPPFVWVPLQPAEKNFNYIIQVSKDREFKTNVISRRGINISTYALDQVLEPGVWYWRYGVDGGKGEWFWKYGMEKGINDRDLYPELTPGKIFFSKARMFTVKQEAKIWNLPKINVLMKSIPTSRPRLLILKDELGSYRVRAKYGDLKKLTSDIIKECEDLIDESLIEEVPATDSILKYLNTPGIDVGAKYQDETCSYTRYSMNMMEKFGLLYLLTGEEKYGEEAKRRIIHYFSWNPEGATSYEANNEAAMWMLYKGITSYDWTYDLFNPDEREQVERVMRFRLGTVYHMLKDKYTYHSFLFKSHPARMCSFLAEGAICFADKWPEAKDWLKYALTMFWNFYPAWAKDDGGWHEGPNYGQFYLSIAIHSSLAIKKAIGLDMTEKEVFNNIPYYYLYTNPPYAKMSPFGDVQHFPPSYNAPQYELANRGEMLYSFSSLMNNPYARWYAEATGSGPGNNILGILLKNDRIISKSPADLPQARYFPGVGLVSLHTELGNAENDISFLFHSDPYGSISHSRPDQNAFTLEAFGEALAIGTGYYPWWNSLHCQKWSYTTRSSNSVTIDGGKGQAFQDATASGEILKFESNDLYDYSLGDATKAYKGALTRFLRHVVHIKPGIFILFDELEAPKPVTFEWWLHAPSEMKIDGNNRQIHIEQGDVRLKVSLLQSGKFNFEQIKGFPDAPPEHGEPDQFHAIVSTASKIRKTSYISLLVPFKKESEPAVTVENLKENTDKVSLELNFKGKRYFIGFVPNVEIRLMK